MARLRKINFFDGFESEVTPADTIVDGGEGGSFNGIPQTTLFLTNGATEQAVTGFIFASESVRQFEATFVVTRSFTDATPQMCESGTLSGCWTGSDWEVSISSHGEIGIDLDITSLGQVIYTTESIANTDDIEFSFIAYTLIQ